MEVILEFVFEIGLQLFGEVLVELGWRAAGEVFEKRKFRNPWLAGLGSLMLGALAGLISLIFLRHHCIRPEPGRVLNLLLTPLAAGFVMWSIGRWRIKNEKDTIRLESFWQGFAFALGMGLVRYFLAE